MKKISIFIIAILLSSINLLSQPDTSTRYFPDRYKLDIPEEWKKPKMIEAISEILPRTLDEYIDSNKQFCLDCNAGLTVMLVIDKPYFSRDGETFQFRAALGLFDTTGKELIELLLVSPEEKHNIKLRAEYNYNSTRYYNKYNRENVYTDVITGTDGRIINVIRTPMYPQPIGNSGPVLKKEGTSTNDLVNIAESRVYQIKDILVNIKEAAAKD